MGLPVGEMPFYFNKNLCFLAICIVIDFQQNFLSFLCLFSHTKRPGFPGLFFILSYSVQKEYAAVTAPLIPSCFPA